MATGVLYFDLSAIVTVGTIVWAVGLGVVRLGFGAFRRERLLVQS